MEDRAATPNEVEQIHKLLDIFSPTRAHRRRKLIANGGRFVHYTTADAALNIIRSKRLWLRNTTCMSDFREAQHGYDLLRVYLTRERPAFQQALDACFPGLTQEVLELFDRLWNHAFLGSFIASISEHSDSEDAHGRLSMWRAFGQGARVAVVLKLPLTSGIGPVLRISLNPVDYMNDFSFQTEMTQVLSNIASERAFLCNLGRDALKESVVHMLLQRVVSTKHEGFNEEREWRIIHSPSIFSSTLMQSVIQPIGGVPQRIYLLPLDASVSETLGEIDLASLIDRIIIGPTQYGFAMAEGFFHELSAAGISDAASRVVVSGIPIRT